MTNDLEDHAARFDEKAGEYDDELAPEHRACVEQVVEHAAPNADPLNPPNELAQVLADGKKYVHRHR
jgi:hypothetical protein